MSESRQLAAIMFTDIEGYTSLMQKSEKEAIALRKRHRDTFELTTEAFNGEIIQYFGDGTLSIFKSTVEAVDCAIELQRCFQQEPKVPVRIAVHVGDIMRSQDDIIGDAVNVASRIESCAVAGSILISDKVHDQIRSHRHIKTKFLDAFQFKNVTDPLPLFSIVNEGLVIPDVDEIKGNLQERSKARALSLKKNSLITIAAIVLLFALALTLSYKYFIADKSNPNDLSIAVLPFDNLSTDEDSEIFRDGITEDILTHLSKFQELHVISRTSVSQFKDIEFTISEVARKLDVNYVLIGSIRKYGDKLRVSTQLILVKTDEHIWTEQYDRTITDIFEIQTDVSREIAQALNVNLTAAEEESISNVTTHNVEAYKLFLQGRKEADKRTPESLSKSIDLYEQAIAIDSSYAEAYAEIGHSIYLQTYYSGRYHIEAAETAHKYLDKAEEISPNVARIYSVRGMILNIEGKTDLARSSFSKALTLSPNDLTARYQFANMHYYTKEYDKQLEQAEMAYRLDPLSFTSANAYFTALLTNKKYNEAELLIKKIDEEGIENNRAAINRSYFRLYMDLRNYEKAIYHAEKVIDEFSIYNRFLGYCYAKIGNTDGAYKMLEDVKVRTPDIYKSHQKAVIYAGLKLRDSVFHYLDTSRNKMTSLFMMDRPTFFEEFEGDPKFIELLKAHGLPEEME